MAPLSRTFRRCPRFGAGFPWRRLARDRPYLTIEMTVKSSVEPYVSLEMRTVALP